MSAWVGEAVRGRLWARERAGKKAGGQLHPRGRLNIASQNAHGNSTVTRQKKPKLRKLQTTSTPQRQNARSKSYKTAQESPSGMIAHGSQQAKNLKWFLPTDCEVMSTGAWLEAHGRRGLHECSLFHRNHAQPHTVHMTGRSPKDMPSGARHKSRVLFGKSK